MSKYVVLDRDGVINVDLFDYVLDTKDFKFEKGSFDALVKLAENDFEIIVATNQKCINLGLISAEGIEEINDFLSLLHLPVLLLKILGNVVHHKIYRFFYCLFFF